MKNREITVVGDVNKIEDLKEYLSLIGYSRGFDTGDKTNCLKIDLDYKTVDCKDVEVKDIIEMCTLSVDRDADEIEMLVNSDIISEGILYDGVMAYPPEGDIWWQQDSTQGVKEEEGKVKYSELDWGYIDSMAERMTKNLDKYPSKNWQKDMDIVKLAESAMRHARKILQSIEGDQETLQEHATALGCNGMMIAFNLNKQK